MNGHRYAIKHTEDTPVGCHFTKTGHTLHVSGLQKTQEGELMRRIVERRWISRLKDKKSPFTLLNSDDGVDATVLML